MSGRGDSLALSATVLLGHSLALTHVLSAVKKWPLSLQR